MAGKNEWESEAPIATEKKEKKDWRPPYIYKKEATGKYHIRLQEMRQSDPDSQVSPLLARASISPAERFL